MRKKNRKKMTLNVDTVRKLDNSELDGVVGAATDTCATVCYAQTCICTMLCSIRTCPP